MHRHDLVRGWVLAGSLALAVSPASAKNPQYVSRARIGAALGATPMARGDAARSAISAEALPPRLALQAERRVVGGIATGMLSDGRGRLIIAPLTPSLVQLSPRGDVEWTRSLGDSPAVVQPVLTSDGTRVVLTATNQVFGFDPSGRLKFKRQLEAGFGVSADLLPLVDGSVVIALGNRVLRLSSSGQLQDSANTGSKVLSLLATQGLGSAHDGVLALTSSGALLRWRTPHPPRRIANLSGVPKGAVLAGRHLLVILEGNRLVDVDLPTLTQHTRWRLSGAEVLDSPIALPGGDTLSWTTDGLLLRHTRAGAEMLRVSLEPGVSGPSPVTQSPVLADKNGRFAFSRAGVGLGIVEPDGALHFVEGASCDVPVSLIDAGGGRFALGCRSGVLWLLKAQD